MNNNENGKGFTLILSLVLSAVFILSLFDVKPHPKKEPQQKPIIVNNYITNPVIRTEVIYKNISSVRKSENGINREPVSNSK